MNIDITDKHLAHVVLRNIFRFDSDIFADPERLRGYLLDLFKGEARIEKILKQAISENTASKILMFADLDEADRKMQIENLKMSFREDHFFRSEISNYVIDCFVFAYGWIDCLAEYIEPEESKINISSFTDFHSKTLNDGTYLGELNSDKIRSGFGTFKGDNDMLYSGEWRVDSCNGCGVRLDLSSREKYAGEWRMNKATGVGVKLMSDGSKYAGRFHNGKMKGLGISYALDGESKMGKYVNGVIEGYGIQAISNDEYLIGQFVNGKLSGKCTHVYSDGRVETEMIY